MENMTMDGIIISHNDYLLRNIENIYFSIIYIIVSILVNVSISSSL